MNRTTTSVGQVPMDRLRSIFDGMFDGVWLVGGDGRTTYANRAMAELLGVPRNGMRGRSIQDFLDAEEWLEVEAFLARQRVHAGERMEACFRRADGTNLFGLVAGSPILTDDGTFVGTMLNVSDVTGKRSMDAQIVQNQRLEAIGQFAGGIAHDFNNLLTSIQGYTEFARSSLPPDDPIRADLDQVLASADRAGSITKKLLAFTRRQVLLPSDVDPAVVIADLVPILRPLLGDAVNVVLDAPLRQVAVRVDPTQLEQIILNLAVNARDAMPSGGTLSIAIRSGPPPDPERPDPDLTAGPFVRISVTDDGQGMDEETRTRIFDPFFTTKGPGKGTGLGLSTVFGIVAQSSGQIQVETEPGRGSTFHVDLPRVRPAATADPPEEDSEMATRTGVVLLAEDDAAVREFARRSLELGGHTVIAAASGNQALEISSSARGRIDILVTDVVMPGLQGPELAEQVRIQRPDIAVVMMSGHAENGHGQGLELDPTVEFLAKPFTVDEINRLVGRALAEARIRSD
ncbi:MAG: PAS domain S-box protein [Chloroflexi bacterium]|nr:PAS domain S-box protein [Chloroflexota bacterium]